MNREEVRKYALAGEWNESSLALMKTNDHQAVPIPIVSVRDQALRCTNPARPVRIASAFCSISVGISRLGVSPGSG